MEIERKWLLNDLPDEATLHGTSEQFYLSHNPEVRLRAEGQSDSESCRFLMVVKDTGASSLLRAEIEQEVNKVFYDGCKVFALETPIKKENYFVWHGNKNIRFSIVDENFIYAEVEFEDEKEAVEYRFPWPDLIKFEVTNDRRFFMSEYARNGFIPIEDLQ